MTPRKSARAAGLIQRTRGIRNDVVAALKALKVPDARWPGGCFADDYHWRKGIGPQRVVTLNPNWGGVTESNMFGTHEFMDFVEQIGSEAYISVNVVSGTRAKRPAAGCTSDAQDCGWSRRRRYGLDRDHHEGVAEPRVQLG